MRGKLLSKFFFVDEKRKKYYLLHFFTYLSIFKNISVNEKAKTWREPLSKFFTLPFVRKKLIFMYEKKKKLAEASAECFIYLPFFKNLFGE